MKKTFITILSFLYLVSGIGFGSVQHYCQKIQKIMSPDENQCCSVELISESPIVDQLPESPDTNSCCDIMVTTSAPSDNDTKYPGDCCQVQHKYNQLDNSSLPLSFDVSQVATSSSVLYYYPQHPQNIDGCGLTIITDSSTHVNLPLLI